MEENKLTRRDILERVANGNITEEQALEQIKHLVTRISDNSENTGINQFSPAISFSDLLFSRIKEDVVHIVSMILHVDILNINMDEDLSDMGFESISYTEFADQLNSLYGIDISAAIFFEYTTFTSFFNYLIQEYNDELMKYYRDSFVHPEVDVIVPGGQKKGVKKKRNRFQKKRGYFVKPISQQPAAHTHIAIIGISGMLPQAPNLDMFWENLVAGKDCITEIPEDRWDWREFYGNPLKEANKTNVKWGGFISDIDKFDAKFFGISPHEAELMDPQQRLLLQTVWNTIEDAGYKPSDLSATKTGVFVGATTSDYNELLTANNTEVKAHTGTGMFHAMLANRISFLLDLHGPSKPIDTACASSLVAVHRAVESICSGQCNMAIAGGVNALLTPKLFISFNKAGMLNSTDGRCKSFDATADGYVRSEGVGAILLKSLTDAERDGDHIYAVIIGSAENHGGRSRTLTAPNPVAQANVIIEAYTKANIDPRTVSYIEAQGTGTKIGDPIEINGLKKAFTRLYEKWGLEIPEEPTCGIGTVKTNIGHLEIASGMAGIFKVILSLKNKTIPGMLHFSHLNPGIKLKKSPFYIVDSTREWNAIHDENGKLIPRRAGISAFGFGGSNSHIVLEEYFEMEPADTPKMKPPYLIILSAKEDESLKNAAENLYFYMKNYAPQEKEVDEHSFLTSVAYTLQVGRESLNRRLALIIQNRDELLTKLEKFTRGKTTITGLLLGQYNKKKNKGIAMLDDQDRNQIIQRALAGKNYNKLIKLWIEGLDFNWKNLYSTFAVAPRRLSLPGYSFKKTRYWIPEVDDISSFYSATTSSWQLHPLLMENVSTLYEQRFRSVFSGNEFFFRDHIIFGRKVLPGVVSLEMLCAAGSLAGENKVTELENVSWNNPVVISGNACELFVGVYPGHGRTEVEVYSVKKNDFLVHAKGFVHFTPVKEKRMETIDIDALQSRCTELMEGNTCYELFSSIGLSYGPHFRGIKEIFFNKTEALALIELPSGLEKEMDRFIIHPSLLDCVKQTIVSLLNGKVIKEKNPFVPFSVSRIYLADKLPETGYMYITFSENYIPENIEPPIFDIVFTNVEGNVCVNLEGFTFVPMKKSAVVPCKQKTNDITFYTSEWTKSDASVKTDTEHGNVLILDFDAEMSKCVSNLGPDNGIKDVFTVVPNGQVKRIDEELHEIDILRQEDYSKLFTFLHEQDRFPRYIVHNLCYDLFIEDKKTLAHQLERGIYSLFYLTKALLMGKLKKPVDLYFFFPGAKADPQPQYEAVEGFFKTLAKENPKLRFKGIMCKNLSPVSIAGYIKNEIHLLNQHDKEVMYADGNRYVRKARFLDIDGCQQDSLRLKNDGVYIITGGLGGLGLIFANHIVSQCKAGIALTGRSKLTSYKKKKLDKLRKTGIDIRYYITDVSNQDQVDNLINRVKKEFGTIHGVVHCAGVIRDSFLIKKTKEDFDVVFKSKIYGTICLDEATKNEDLDFVLLFSSVSSVIGNVGQGDYAFANNFMDRFAGKRNLMVKAGERTGKTISINWPLWQSGGMKPDEASTSYLYNTTGILPLSTDKGLAAFDRILRLTFDHIGVFDGDLSRFADQLKIAAPEGTEYEPATVQTQTEPRKQTVAMNVKKKSQIKPDSSGDLLSQIEMAILKICSGILKINKDEIDMDAEFTDFGLDSILMIKMMNQVEETFKITVEPNSVTLYPTITNFSHYLLDKGIVNRDEMESVEDSSPVEENTDGYKSTPTRRKQRFAGDFGHQQAYKKIAVISMACRFPESPNLETFWENLKNGRNCISIVPEDRWDVDQYYSEDKDAPKKSYSKWGGFIQNIYAFDADFFGIKDDDAQVLDPQHRIILELTQELIDRAGYRRKDMSGSKTAVFLGGNESSYVQNNIDAISEKQMRWFMVNKIQNMMAARISDYYNLKGTSLVIDTACSSTLVAIHEACKSIVIGESDAAITGGIEIIIDPWEHIGFSKSGALSDGPYSFVFDERARGFVLGEGAGLIMLKDYDKAVADGDQILGTIVGSAVNNDGKTMGLTVPNQDGQSEVIAKALESSGINPETITLYEAHGTGTLLGDPIEIKAATKIYRKYTDKKQYCAVGSVKSNVGHLLRAAGIAGVIKLLLSMKYKQLPPTLHCEHPHPRFKFEESPFYPIRKIKEWKPKNGVRRAAISSFGFGGTNGHLIFEEFNQDKVDQYKQKREALPLTKFKRKQYRLNKEIFSVDEDFDTNELAVNEINAGSQNKDDTQIKERILLDDEKYREMLYKLQSGELTPEELIEMEGE